MLVTTIDYHTAGEPFRIVTGGVGPIPGETILDKRRYAAERLDRVRQLLIHEPRGHADMYGCFVTEPEDEGADLGVVFFHNAGYSTACGHGTIALATAAVETGMVARAERETELVLDAPSGRLRVTVELAGGRVKRARFRNVPSFVFAEGVAVETAHGVVEADIAYGGAFYAFVDPAALDVDVSPPNLDFLIAVGRDLKRAIEREHEIVHPLESELRDIYGVVFVEVEADAPERRERNVAIFADGEVDRSPCGSGTSARLALLDAHRELERGTAFVNTSVIGTEFEARIVGDAEVAGLHAIIPEVAGSAHLTGFHQFVLEDDDPLGTGFLLR
ncbi:MAG: proline racemase family protein [Actinobacteria bacterium]|nr:proline racemase family protein [Actinomycetota bacterium]